MQTDQVELEVDMERKVLPDEIADFQWKLEAQRSLNLTIQEDYNNLNLNYDNILDQY